MGQEADVAYYDQLHGAGGTYDLPVRRSPYYPLFRRIVDRIAAGGYRRVLEVGCGSGALAELILTETRADYRGFDFSATAVDKATARVGSTGAGRAVFAVGDATDPASYRWDYDVIVCTEVLEHIAADKTAIGLWRSGVPCLCSVPNFDYEGHVRFFRSAAEVRARYDDVIAIAAIERIAKPVRAGTTLGDYLRQLRWSRDDPRRLMGLLGIHTFDAIGGWFLFDGVTRPR
jgi:SAM-dependent methyltransferase